MERKILSLNEAGKVVVKSPDGKERSLFPWLGFPGQREAVVFLLVDCSSSMEGEKIDQVKQGVLDFAKTAFRKGYRVGLISFAGLAAMICEPTNRLFSVSGAIEQLVACGGTNLTPALKMAFNELRRKKGLKTVLVATDGFPGDPNSALEIAGIMKKDRIEILCISTEDADQEFLAKLASRKDLNLKVERNEFRKGMDAIARKLPVQFLEDKR